MEREIQAINYRSVQFIFQACISAKEIAVGLDSNWLAAVGLIVNFPFMIFNLDRYMGSIPAATTNDATVHRCSNGLHDIDTSAQC